MDQVGRLAVLLGLVIGIVVLSFVGCSDGGESASARGQTEVPQTVALEPIIVGEPFRLVIDLTRRIPGARPRSVTCAARRTGRTYRCTAGRRPSPGRLVFRLDHDTGEDTEDLDPRGRLEVRASGWNTRDDNGRLLMPPGGGATILACPVLERPTECLSVTRQDEVFPVGVGLYYSDERDRLRLARP